MAKALSENDLQAASGGVHSRIELDGSVTFASDWGRADQGNISADTAKDTKKFKIAATGAGDVRAATVFYFGDQKLDATNYVDAIAECYKKGYLNKK